VRRATPASRVDGGQRKATLSFGICVCEAFSVLTHQFRELTAYLHQFNELQLDRLRSVCCEGARASGFLCDLMRRFVDEEHVRRYGRPEPLQFIVVREQPAALLERASADARDIAIRVGQEPPDRLTRVELLPLAVFLEQVSARLESCLPAASAQIDAR
jgi:hypothetical protein